MLNKQLQFNKKNNNFCYIF